MCLNQCINSTNNYILIFVFSCNKEIFYLARERKSRNHSCLFLKLALKVYLISSYGRVNYGGKDQKRCFPFLLQSVFAPIRRRRHMRAYLLEASFLSLLADLVMGLSTRICSTPVLPQCLQFSHQPSSLPNSHSSAPCPRPLNMFFVFSDPFNFNT